MEKKTTRKKTHNQVDNAKDVTVTQVFLSVVAPFTAFRQKERRGYMRKVNLE